MNPRPSDGEVHRVVFDSAAAGERLDAAVARALPRFSRSRVQTLIRSGLVTRKGQPVRASQPVREGDEVRLVEPPVEPSGVSAEDIELDVLFEDESLLVINKPVGMVVHPGAGNASGTLVNALLHHCRDLSGIGGVERPGIVHRLDKGTSGCLVVAKTDAVHRGLAGQFARHEVLKIYLALAQGRPRWSQKRAEFGIARHPVNRKKMCAVEIGSGKGRVARTDFRVLHLLGDASMIECRLHTGRTHQIRVHLQKLGHPIAGDRLYGGAAREGCGRVMLHSWQLGFKHPRTGKEMHLAAPLPEDFARAILPFTPDSRIR